MSNQSVGNLNAHLLQRLTYLQLPKNPEVMDHLWFTFKGENYFPTDQEILSKELQFRFQFELSDLLNRFGVAANDNGVSGVRTVSK